MANRGRGSTGGQKPQKLPYATGGGGVHAQIKLCHL